jgi:endonuclease YncB( thermonuclease family)
MAPRPDPESRFPGWLLVCAALGWAPVPAPSEPEPALRSLEVRVVGVADGDTITVRDPNGPQRRIRLSGIDAPERGQAFGERSRQSLAGWVFGREVTIQWSRLDRHGRIVAKVLIAPPGECAPPCTARIDVNLAQVEAGMAWHYRQFEQQQQPADRLAYAAAEMQAREQRIGLWRDPNPVPPWEWRRSR